MFELVTIRRAVDAKGQLDAGLLAEALLFYGQVHLILDRRSLLQLLKEIGIENLLRMFRSGHARASYVQDNPGVLTQQHGPKALHWFLQIRAAGKREGDRWSAEHEVRELLGKAGHTPKSAKMYARQLCKLLPGISLNNGSSGKAPDFPAVLASEVRAEPNLVGQAQLVLDGFLPGLPRGRITRFQLEEVQPGGFFVNTDLDWSAAQSDFKRLSAGVDGGDLTPAGVLERILDGYVDLGLAARFGSELVTSPMAERLISHRVRQIMQRRARSDEEIAAFNHDLLGDSFAIRAAINSKARSFAAFLDILDKAERFKSMLQKANPDTGLLKAYVQEVTKETWLDALAPKAVRFGMFTLSAAAFEALFPSGVGLALGVGTGVFDQFVLDKLARGWRPNTFIDNVLRPFAFGEDNEG
jgi:hypothetical protein